MTHGSGRRAIFRWDADDTEVPVPSPVLAPTVVTFNAVDGGIAVGVTQIVASAETAGFLAAAWSESLPLLARVGSGSTPDREIR